MHDAESNYYTAYEVLINPIRNRMIRAIWQITQDEDDAEEAMQEALANIWKKIDRILKHENPQALILRMCHNAAYDVLRAKIRRRKREALLRTLTLGSTPNSPDCIVANKERESIILRAIARLSRNQSLAVLLRCVQNKSYEEIAHILGCTEVTARKHVARGRQRLKVSLPILLELNPEEYPLK